MCDLCRWSDGSNLQELMAGFDQEAAAVVVARLATFKMETEEDFDATRWIDRTLIRHTHFCFYAVPLCPIFSVVGFVGVCYNSMLYFQCHGASMLYVIILCSTSSVVGFNTVCCNSMLTCQCCGVSTCKPWNTFDWANPTPGTCHCRSPAPFYHYVTAAWLPCILHLHLVGVVIVRQKLKQTVRGGECATMRRVKGGHMRRDRSCPGVL